MVTRSFAPVLVVAAAFVFGGAVVLGFSTVDSGLAEVLVAVAVVAVGAGVALLPDADVVTVGTGLIAFGAGLFGSTASTDAIAIAASGRAW